MSVFGKVWRVVKSARRAVAVVADVGDAVEAIVKIGWKPIRVVMDAARKADRVVEAVEEAVKKNP